ncbi:TetR/AcrR family transcriptional regulator [Ramlibacter henchirensis]|uniref:TetR/AcrR family transcriptional regulator n=2 Tax=Ramlibacter henchirensis TaxID=204072 RepID=A0A4Z0CB14_9BURK|nr:TetR/AcrR family transcriptional regulator [Ramlibacter henchirensis]
MLAAREEAIIQNVNRLLAEKGFDAMTVDEVAAAVGIAKASLYKHFPSKEDLAAAAMVRVMRRAQQFLASVDPALPMLDKLKSAVRWTLQVRLAGQMPSLPSQNSSLRAALMSSRDYRDALTGIGEQLGEWIEAGQREGAVDPKLPSAAVLYTLYARACDPVVEFLKAAGQHTDEQIVDLVLSTCFDGLSAR